MRHNGRAPLYMSTTHPARLDLSRPVKTARCPYCDRWGSLNHQGRLTPHKSDADDPPGVLLCTGTGQRFYSDLDTEEWEHRCAEITGDAARIKSPRESTQASKPPPGVRLA